LISRKVHVLYYICDVMPKWWYPVGLDAFSIKQSSIQLDHPTSNYILGT
jgi:hypothetical protein